MSIYKKTKVIEFAMSYALFRAENNKIAKNTNIL